MAHLAISDLGVVAAALPKDVAQRAVRLLQTVESPAQSTQDQVAFVKDPVPRPDRDLVRRHSRDAAAFVADIRPTVAALEHQLSEMVAEASPRLATARYSHPLPPAIHEAGIGRFVWVLGVGGSGTRADRNFLDSYLSTAATWLSFWHLLNWFEQTVDRDQPWRTGLFSAERYRRIYSFDTRLSAFSRSLCRGVATWATEQRDPEARLNNTLNESTVDATFEYLKDALNTSPGELRPPDTICGGLLREIAFPGGSYRGRQFVDLVVHPDLERFPIVLIDGDPYPLALREAVYGLEVPILAALQKIDSHYPGSAFESAVGHAVTQYAPDDLGYDSGPLVIRDGARRLETDFALHGAQTTWVGECKGMIPNDAVDPGFTDHVGKALGQVHERRRLLDVAQPLVRADRSVVERSRRNDGLVVLLHTYGAEIWNGEALGAVHGHDQGHVFSVHGLLLALSAVHSARDFRRYLYHRQTFLKRGVHGRDELEGLLLYLNGDRPPPPLAGHLTPVFSPWSLPPELVFSTELPNPRTRWRYQLQSEAVAR